MTKFYAVAKRASIAGSKLYRLRDGYYTYTKTNPEIEATSNHAEARRAAQNLTETTGKVHFASLIATTP